MIVSEFMQPNRKLYRASVDDKVAVVAGIMSHSDLDQIPIVDSDDRVFGVIDSEMIVDFYANGGNANRTNAWEICEHNFLRINPYVSIYDAIQLLKDYDAKFVLVLQEGRLTGILEDSHIISQIVVQPDQAEISFGGKRDST